jgi:hypothetical protein
MKFFIWILVIAGLGAAAFFGYRWYREENADLSGLTLVPEHAVYVIETDSPIDSWKTISGSLQWKHLQKNQYFASLTSSINALDSMVHDNELLFELLGSRAVMVSSHMVSGSDYDFLFVVDLQEASLVSVLQQYLTNFSAKGYSLTKEMYQGEQLFLVHSRDDNSTLHLFMKGPFMAGSYDRSLVAAAIHASQGENLLNSESFKNNLEKSDDGIARVYINYPMLPAFTAVYMTGQNEYVQKFSAALLSSQLVMTLENEAVRISGFTAINDSIESYILSLHVSGKGPTEITQIAPQRTAFYLGLGFSSFSDFLKNFEINLKTDVTEYASYQENIKKVEDYLKIDLQKNFIDWVGDEVAILELPSSGSGAHNETALIFKAHNVEAAKDNLAYIEKMVKRKTPVKFKTFDHKGYSINYLSLKGIFNLLLGKFFARYDKPYYTIINNFVIFSNTPESLKGIINDYLDKKTLARSEDFRSFRKEFEDESSAFVYMHAPALFNSIVNLANPATRVSLVENKAYVTCFRDMGLQLVPVEYGFKTAFAEQFVEPEIPVIVVPKVEHQETVSTAEEIIEEIDPMALPELYIENPNLKEYIGYFPDSTVQFKVEMNNGFKEGSYTEYHPNTETRLTGRFRRDQRHGTWKLFDEAGKLVLKREYRDGEITKERE